MSLTPEQMDEIRKALDAATPGPWEAAESDDGHEILMGTAIVNPGHYDSHHMIEYNHCCYYDEDDCEAGQKQALEAEANATLIANAPTWIKQLLDTVEAHAAEIERWKQEALLQARLYTEKNEKVEQLRAEVERLSRYARERDEIISQLRAGEIK
jgi:hypothetical protein